MGIDGNPEGKIVHHDLEKDGTINYYNIQIDENTYSYIPARMVEATKVHEHKHEAEE